MTEAVPFNNQESDTEFDVADDTSADFTTTIDRLKQFSFYLVENVELNLTLCLKLLEERDVPAQSNSLYTTAFSKLLLAVPKLGAVLGNALSKGEIIVFDKIDKNNSRKLADLVYYFSDHKDEMRSTLIQSAVDIFYSFECQFMKLTCKGGPKRAMQKLAKDASDRIFNYFLETEQNRNVTRAEITKGVLFGDSKRNKLGVKAGKTVMEGEIKWKTCKLYQKTGIVVEAEQAFFTNENCNAEKYGYRRLLSWEDVKDIRETWELQANIDVPNYALTVKEEVLKIVRDYVMTKNPDEFAKLERENYSKEAQEDRQIKHEEVLKTFDEHFKELLEELEHQYKVLVDSHSKNNDLSREIVKNQGEEKVFHREINTKLEEIKKEINDTRILIELSEASREEVVQNKQDGAGTTLTVEEVKVIARGETNKNLKKQLVELVRDKLGKNDPGPKIRKEVTRIIKKW